MSEAGNTGAACTRETLDERCQKAWALCESASALEAARAGTVFTPRRVALALARAALEGWPSTGPCLRVLDPACGSGALLLAVLELWTKATLLSKSPPPVLELWAIDLNEDSLRLCELALRELAQGFPWCIRICCERGDALEMKYGEYQHELTRMMEKNPISLYKKLPPSCALIVSNPPYQRASRRQTAALRGRFECARGSFDLFVPFVEQALRCLAPAGRMALLVPNKLFSADYAAALRRLLLRDCPPRLLFELGADRSFRQNIDVALCLFERNTEASVETCVMAQSRKRCPELEQDVRDLLALASGESLSSAHLSAHAGRLSPLRDSASWSVNGCANSALLLQRLEAMPTAAALPWRTGVMGFAYHDFLSALREAEGDEHALRVLSPALIRGFRHCWAQKSVLLGAKRWSAPVLGRRPSSASDACWAWLSQPKVLVAGVSSRLGAFVDEQGQYAPLVAVHGAALSIPRAYVLSALLSSRLLDWWWKTRFASARIPQGSYRLSVAMLRALPLPDTVWCSELESFARRLHADHQGDAAQPLGTPQSSLASEHGRESASTEEPSCRAQMDELIFELYGLSTDERAWVLAEG